MNNILVFINSVIVGAIFIWGLIFLAEGIFNKDLAMITLGAFAMSVSGLILIGSLTASESNEKFCLMINNTQQTVDNLEVNVKNIFYWIDGVKYKILSQDTNIYFTEGNCNVSH